MLAQTADLDTVFAVFHRKFVQRVIHVLSVGADEVDKEMKDIVNWCMQAEHTFVFSYQVGAFCAAIEEL